MHEPGEEVELEEAHLRVRLDARPVRTLHRSCRLEHDAVDFDAVESDDELSEHRSVEIDDTFLDGFRGAQRRAAEVLDRRPHRRGDRGRVDRVAEVADSTSRRQARHICDEHQLATALVGAGAARPDPDRDRHLRVRDLVGEVRELVVVDDGLTAVELDDERLRVVVLGALDRLGDEVDEDRIQQAAHLDHVDRCRLVRRLRRDRGGEQPTADEHRAERGAEQRSAEGGAHAG